MGKQRVPAIKDWTGINIINNLLYLKEALKIETNIERKEMLQIAFDKAQLNMKEYETKIVY